MWKIYVYSVKESSSAEQKYQNSFPDAKTEPISSQVAPLTSFEVAFCEELVLFFLLLNCLVIFVQHDYPRVLCYIR